MGTADSARQQFNKHSLLQERKGNIARKDVLTFAVCSYLPCIFERSLMGSLPCVFCRVAMRLADLHGFAVRSPLLLCLYCFCLGYYIICLYLLVLPSLYFFFFLTQTILGNETCATCVLLLPSCRNQAPCLQPPRGGLWVRRP